MTIIPKLRLAKAPEVFVQAKIRSDIFNKTKSIIERRGLKWRDVIEACFESFVEEMEENEQKLKRTSKSKK